MSHNSQFIWCPGTEPRSLCMLRKHSASWGTSLTQFLTFGEKKKYFRLPLKGLNKKNGPISVLKPFSVQLIDNSIFFIFTICSFMTHTCGVCVYMRLKRQPVGVGSPRHDVATADPTETQQQVPLPAAPSHRPHILPFYNILEIGSAIISIES